MSDPCRRSFVGVCRGGVSVRDLWRRNFVGVSQEVSVSVICAAAVIWVFAQEVSVSATCVAAGISAFAKEVSV